MSRSWLESFTTNCIYPNYDRKCLNGPNCDLNTGTLEYDFIYLYYVSICPNMLGFELNITVIVLNVNGFVLYITMNGFALNS